MKDSTGYVPRAVFVKRDTREPDIKFVNDCFQEVGQGRRQANGRVHPEVVESTPCELRRTPSTAI
ncbi:hypothetical protein M407DRAFT_246195 [Tulasnella calospora MUT 4182]|uniref:Uncharacterized protein n=1 Tax=Tulasnella calospora MUT 4182 TaxID=1051891 RepID=A0A0C3Q766_9AGAM|nr:hypothetical protein M407DRAFT_246195 [Tulasnella calospora MUT 4182]